MPGNDSRIMFEYKINGRELKKGDYFEYYDAKGEYTYVFGENTITKEIGWIRQK